MLYADNWPVANGEQIEEAPNKDTVDYLLDDVYAYSEMLFSDTSDHAKIGAAARLMMLPLQKLIEVTNKC